MSCMGYCHMAIFFSDFLKSIINKHNAKLQQTDPGKNVTDIFSTKARIFPPNIQKGFLLSPLFYLEKNTLK